jgi:hypothetical protein
MVFAENVKKLQKIKDAVYFNSPKLIYVFKHDMRNGSISMKTE